MAWLADSSQSDKLILVLAVTNLLLGLYHWRKGHWGADYLLARDQQFLLIKPKGLGVVGKKPVHKIDITRLAKIQVAGKVVSFFYQSGHAIDVFLSRQRLASFVLEVVTLVPTVELVKLEHPPKGESI
ncbi:hypothetical protein DXX93_16100 [Thalassotalea euphylliae]|uniref:Uncharacterized protein n=1 Tax=Thalassotalea euphylliae TaxID=1655234 RepID=A0A3E0TVH8_9GAMM|nr:hypothetical protein [Thalassotalea euphylliae]REL27932.1 hypothetical protein DXX93_16100 [Thalassotalea euphylliae]